MRSLRKEISMQEFSRVGLGERRGKDWQDKTKVSKVICGGITEQDKHKEVFY